MDRKKFIQASLLASSGILLSSMKKKMSLSGLQFLSGNIPLFSEYGIQLWTIKQDMYKDPKKSLVQVASYGYKIIESFDGKDGIFWGMHPKDFKTYLDSLGLKINSTHINIKKDFEKKVEQLASIGAKYAICPYVGPQENLDKFKAIADDFNKKGEICKKYGLRFAYHNHDYSFKKVEGEFPQDILMTRTNTNLVDFQMDIYWVVVGGQDPIVWLEKYPNKFVLCHVKDLKKNPTKDNSKNSCTLGTGQINFSKILPKAKTMGMKHFIVEQEAFDNSTPLESIAQDAKYMEKYKT